MFIYCRIVSVVTNLLNSTHIGVHKGINYGIMSRNVYAGAGSYSTIMLDFIYCVVCVL
jgi:hypothetical protein